MKESEKNNIMPCEGLTFLFYSQKMITTDKTLLVVCNYTWTFCYETAGQNVDLVQTIAMPYFSWTGNIERINKIKFAQKYLVNTKYSTIACFFEIFVFE